jgi:Zn-dependent protease with chaperone function
MRLERSQVLFVGFVAGAAAIITVSITTFVSPWTALQLLARPQGWGQVFMRVVAPLLAFVLAAWLARLSFVLTRASVAVRRLPRMEELPDRLSSSIARTGVERITCVPGGVPIAFCTGAVRPEIVVSEGLAERLSDRELDAVLLHENHHVKQWEPAVRAASETAAQVLFFFPLLRWWSRRRTEEAELRADQAAIRKVGPRPVAAALCTLGSAVPAEAAFAGVAELRVAQLLGDPLPVRRPTLALVAASVLGFPLAIAAGTCLVMAISRLEM